MVKLIIKHYYLSKEFGYVRAGRTSKNALITMVHSCDGETTNVVVLKNYNQEDFKEVSKTEFIQHCSDTYMYRNFESWKLRYLNSIYK